MSTGSHEYRELCVQGAMRAGSHACREPYVQGAMRAEKVLGLLFTPVAVGLGRAQRGRSK